MTPLLVLLAALSQEAELVAKGSLGRAAAAAARVSPSSCVMAVSVVCAFL